MELFLQGTLSACVPRFFTDAEGKQIEFFEAGIRTKSGFAVLTSKDFRAFENKECVFKVLAQPSKSAKKAYTLKVVDVALQEDGDTIIR